MQGAKEYNAAKCKVKRSALAAVSINFHVGTFQFNVSACELMNIKAGDMIKFWHRQNTGEWFVSKSQDDGFKLRPVHQGAKGLIFNNTKTAEELADSIKFKEISGSVKIGREPETEDDIDYWPLITAKLIS
jgi:hypothetical protein